MCVCVCVCVCVCAGLYCSVKQNGKQTFQCQGSNLRPSGLSQFDGSERARKRERESMRE